MREQDHYLEYAAAIIRGSFEGLPKEDLRLFPGLPWLLTLGGGSAWWGLVLMLVAWLAAFWGLYKLTGQKKAFLALLFPPAMLASSMVIGTEIVVAACIIWSLYWLIQKQPMLAGAVVGLGLSMRLIAGVVALVSLAWMMSRKRYNESLRYLLILLSFIVSILMWNVMVFGRWDVQLIGYAGYARPEIGLVQLARDIPRAIDWGWYRQVVSGGFYLLLLGYLLVLAIARPASLNGHLLGINRNLIVWVVTGMVGFVFLIGPTPFLEEFPRFLVPVWPLLYVLTFKQWSRWWVWGLPVISLLVVMF